MNKIGDNIKLCTYYYDEDGYRHESITKGKIIQLTDYLIVINNGLYNESFQYTEICYIENYSK